MDQLTDVNAWSDVFVHALSGIGAKAAALLPQLLGAAVLLGVGYALSRAVELAVARMLRSVGLDRAAVRVHLARTLERAGIGLSASEVVARLLFWLLMLVFLLSAVETLGLTAVTGTIDRLVAYVPNVIGAALIALVGLVLARFVSSLVASVAAAADLAGASRLASLTHALLVSLVFVVAAEQLGVATSVLVGPITVVLGAVAGAAGLAFALGARPIVTHILAGHFLKQWLPRDVLIQVDGRRGLVERVGPTGTLLRDGDTRWSVPNGQLLDQIVVH